MRKIIFVFILLAQILNAQYVVDSAGVFSAKFEQNLEQKLSQKDLNTTIFVLTLDSLKNSTDLRRLDEKLTKADKNPLGVVISTKHRKFWIITKKDIGELLGEEEVTKLTLLYAYPYFQDDKYESGVNKMVNSIMNTFNPKDVIFDIKDYEIIIYNYHINFFLVLLVVFIVMFVVLYIVVEDLTFLGLLAILFAVFFVSLFFTLLAYGLLNLLFFELLAGFPSIILSNIVEYSSILLVIIFLWLVKIMLHRGLHLDEYREKARKEFAKYRSDNRYRNYSSSSYSSYSSSSYSGGGGSFGGGGASGSW